MTRCDNSLSGWAALRSYNWKRDGLISNGNAKQQVHLGKFVTPKSRLIRFATGRKNLSELWPGIADQRQVRS
jgi:hypothetical protein